MLQVSEPLFKYDIRATPIIGIAARRKILGMEQLAQDEDLPYDPLDFRQTDEGVQLDPHHSHFILVDGEGGWGDEHEVRRQLEKRLGACGCKSVMLVMQGGPYTLETVWNCAQSLREEAELSQKNSQPIVLISDSGGAASVIAHHLGMHIEQPEGASYLDVYKEWTENEANWKHKKRLDDIREIHEERGRTLVHNFSLTGGRGLEEVIAVWLPWMAPDRP